MKKKKYEGYIYIITNPAWEGWVKIGKSINPKNRLKTFQTSSPFRDYELVYSIKTNDMTNLEYYIHLHLKDKDHYHENGEWFKITKENAIDTLKGFAYGEKMILRKNENKNKNKKK